MLRASVSELESLSLSFFPPLLSFSLSGQESCFPAFLVSNTFFLFSFGDHQTQCVLSFSPFVFRACALHDLNKHFVLSWKSSFFRGSVSVNMRSVWKPSDAVCVSFPSPPPSPLVTKACAFHSLGIYSFTKDLLPPFSVFLFPLLAFSVFFFFFPFWLYMQYCQIILSLFYVASN